MSISPIAWNSQFTTLQHDIQKSIQKHDTAECFASHFITQISIIL